MSKRDTKFDRWISELREDVVQGEYGYEEGEFSVYPEMWRSLFEEGLTPSQAFKRALDAHAEARRQEEAEIKANWERIQREDAAIGYECEDCIGMREHGCYCQAMGSSAPGGREAQQITSIEGEAA